MSAKKLVLGVSSSVSIYKACELARMNWTVQSWQGMAGAKEGIR